MSAKFSFPLSVSKIAIILNGQSDITDAKYFSSRDYETIIVCDGAWNSFTELMPELITKQDIDIVVLGDGDSIDYKPIGFMQMFCQNSTDFEKAINFVLSKQVDDTADIDLDVFWANGGDLDHNLGNLAIASKYSCANKQKVCCHFYTKSQYYRFVSGSLAMTVAADIVADDDNVCSIFPFPSCRIIRSQGLKYPMHDYLMQLHTQQSLRNQITDTQVVIEATGSYFIFISHLL